MQIHGIITQGRGSSEPTQWVTQFKVEYRLDIAAGSAVTVPENFTMASEKQEHVFSTPVYARYVRIVVLAWNNYISMRAALVVKSCSSCPSNAFSQQDNALLEDCKCNAAYTGPDGGPCTACEPGTYKPDTGSAPCQLCPAGTFNSKHAAHAVTSCTLCKHGKYNPDAGSGPETHCIQCPQGKFHRTKGVTSVDECKECSCNAF